ncbi:MAG: hypothetical protein CVU61_11265 [Deltaproteobacteria bacterium HGW-Deltaproteobacteria-19]|jgi:hypothetical protein|nr:MAG: hypothetical protein CVU61_11265 [Deltaproteobacteria bacterium HGW-Deltaproteobacteria-19]
MKRIMLFVFVFAFWSTAQAGVFDQIKGVTDTLEKVTKPITQPTRKAPTSTPTTSSPDRAVHGIPGRPTESQEVKKLRIDFEKAYWSKYSDVYRFWMQYYDSPDRYFDYAPETLPRGREAFREISEGCTTRFQGVTDDPRGDRLARYSVWCKMAIEGDAWLKRAVTNKATFYINQVGESFVNQSKLLAESKGSLGTWDLQYYLNPEARKAEILKFMEKDLKFVGIEKPPDEAFAKADAALAKLIGEIREQVKNWPCYPDGTPMSDAFVQKAVLNDHKGSKFIKNYRQSVGWEVRLNALGVPTHRRMGGKAIFKLPNETWCRAWYYTYLQDYQGRGYGKSYFNYGPQIGQTSICDCP